MPSKPWGFAMRTAFMGVSLSDQADVADIPLTRGLGGMRPSVSSGRKRNLKERVGHGHSVQTRLTTFDLDEYVYEALKADASGFLRKDAPPERLLTFVRSAGEGDALLDPTITRRLIERYAQGRSAGQAAS